MFRERFNRYDGIVSLLPLPLSPLGSLPLASKRGGLPPLYPLMKSKIDKSLALLLPEVRDCPRYTGVSIPSGLNSPPLPRSWTLPSWTFLKLSQQNSWTWFMERPRLSPYCQSSPFVRRERRGCTTFRPRGITLGESQWGSPRPLPC